MTKFRVVAGLSQADSSQAQKEVNDLLSVGIGAVYQVIHIGSQVCLRCRLHRDGRLVLFTKAEQVFEAPPIGFHGVWTELSVGLELKAILALMGAL